jgi:hypothetical protein
LLRSAEAPLAGYDLVSPLVGRPYQERLQDTLGANGVRKLSELGLVEARAWLVRVWAEEVDGDGVLSLTKPLCRSAWSTGTRNQGIETTTKRFSHHQLLTVF